MDLALDPGDQDLLALLLEENGDLGVASDASFEAPLDWDLPISEVGGGFEPGRWGAGCS